MKLRRRNGAVSFPFAWHRHARVQDVEAECLSFSPVIPGDIACSALPVAVFRWRVRNRGDTPVDTSLAFHFANLNRLVQRLWRGSTAARRGRLLQSTHAIPSCRRCDPRPAESVGSAAGGERGMGDRDCGGRGGTIGNGSASMDPAMGRNSGSRSFARGDAPDLGPGWLTESGFRETPPAHPTAAVSCRLALEPDGSKTVTAVLVWDLPEISFGLGRRWLPALHGSMGTVRP